MRLSNLLGIQIIELHTKYYIWHINSTIIKLNILTYLAYKRHMALMLIKHKISWTSTKKKVEHQQIYHINALTLFH
jgi:hypothetical protein